jgi:hypothetical protein
MEGHVLHFVVRDAGVSVRQVEDKLNVSRMTFGGYCMNSYHLQRVQGLKAAEFPA